MRVESWELAWRIGGNVNAGMLKVRKMERFFEKGAFAATFCCDVIRRSDGNGRKSVGDSYHRMLFIEVFRIPGDEDTAFAVGCGPDDGVGKFEPVFSSCLDRKMRDL